MSGLTPILDTLLHQVLGKRGDAGPSPALQPDRIVNAVTALTPPRPPQSDARSQDGSAQALVQNRKAGQGATGAGDAPTRSSAAATLPAHQPAVPDERVSSRDTALRLSAPAQFITHLQRSGREGLVPTVRPPGLLLGSGSSSAQAADETAQRLGNSIGDSGLFYESHLRQWHRGERSVGDLSREPQMRLWQKAPPVVDEDVVRTRDAAAGRSTEVPGDLRQLPQDSQERLHSILRSQLELLGAPTLRWEGEVDEGMLMFMEISLADEDRDAAEGSEREEASTGKKHRDWQTTIELELPHLGDITVALRRTADRMSIDLEPDRAGTADLMSDRLAAISERLEGRGVLTPHIRVSSWDGSNDDRG